MEPRANQLEAARALRDPKGVASELKGPAANHPPPASFWAHHPRHCAESPPKCRARPRQGDQPKFAERMRQFLERFSVRAALLSVVLIVPCEWHRRIEAGDLGSHVYNAWLASLVKGIGPGSIRGPAMEQRSV